VDFVQVSDDEEWSCPLCPFQPWDMEQALALHFLRGFHISLTDCSPFTPTVIVHESSLDRESMVRVNLAPLEYVGNERWSGWK
jgi:hypothetical protein